MLRTASCLLISHSPAALPEVGLDLARRGAHPDGVDKPERGWRPGDRILVDLPDGQTVRCRVVNVKDDGTVQVVPEHAVAIGTA